MLVASLGFIFLMPYFCHGENAVNDTALQTTTVNPDPYGLKTMDDETYRIMKDYLIDSPIPEENEPIFHDTAPIYFRLPFCSCQQQECSCCLLRSDSHDFRTYYEYCVKAFLDLENFNASLALTYNGEVLKDMELNENIVPNLCIDRPVKLPIKACVKVFDISIQQINLKLCLDLNLFYKDAPIFDFHLNCFKLGTKGFKLMRMNDKTKKMRKELKIFSTVKNNYV